MVTPDAQIFGRILREAQTLEAQGYEVIILAGWEEGLPAEEQIGPIKIERVPIAPPNFFTRERIIVAIQGRIIAGLNSLLTFLQYLIGLIFRGLTKIVVFCANQVNHLADMALKLSQKVRGFQLQEQAMLLRALHYQPDIVHVHDLPYLGVGVQAKKRLNLSLVYDSHELYTELGALSLSDKQRLTRLEQQSLPYCDEVITVNPFIAQELARRYQIPSPQVIFNTVTTPPSFQADQLHDRFRQKFQIPATHQLLLFQGWLSLERGLPDLVRAMAQVPNTIHLVFMGYGAAAQQMLEQLAQAENLSNRVHFMEAVPQDELLFWTASADAGIIPYQPVDLNHYYCSPNKLFEFIQAELPIIANDLPFLRRVIAGEGFGLVRPLADVASFAGAIREMFEPQLGGPHRFKANLQNKKSKYNWPVDAAKLLDIYARLNKS